MDLAGGLRCFRPFTDRPGTTFIRSDGEEIDESQHRVRTADQAIQARLLFAQIGQESLRLFSIQLRDLLLDLRRDRHPLGAFLFCLRRCLLDERIRFRIRDVIFRDIQHIKDRLQRDEIQLLQDLQIIFREIKGSCRRPFLQRIEYLFKHRQIELRLLDPCLRELRRLDLLLVDTLQIRQTQLRIDDIHITDRIDRAFYVRDISILEATDDMRDGIRLTDMREELISQTLALGGARYEAGDIDETSERRRRLLRLEHLRQIIDAMIRDLYDAHIRLDGAERKIRRFCSGFCDGIEQRALPYIRKADNADLQIRTHGYSL